MSDTPDNRQSDPAEPRHEHSITAALEMFARGQLTRDQVGELVRRRSRPRGESVQRRWVHDEPYLAAHVVQGQQVLLGTTLCSMAAQLASEEFGVRNLVLVEPVVVPPGASVDVVVQRDDADVSKLVGRFSISGGAQRVTMTAELGDMDDGGRATEPMVVDTFTGTSDRTLSADEIRAVPLLSRAPVLDCVSRVWIRGDEALGRLQLRPEAIAAEGELAVHPALLDGGFVVGGTLVDPAVLTPSDGATWVTMAVRAMRGTGSTLPNACWCRASSVRVTDQLITMDLRFHDDEGRCVLEVDGMTLRRIGGAPTAHRGHWGGPRAALQGVGCVGRDRALLRDRGRATDARHGRGSGRPGQLHGAGGGLRPDDCHDGCSGGRPGSRVVPHLVLRVSHHRRAQRGPGGPARRGPIRSSRSLNGRDPRRPSCPSATGTLRSSGWMDASPVRPTCGPSGSTCVPATT